MAVVHEWLSSWAGSEKTFREIALLFPEADLFALTVAPHMRLDDRPITATFLDRPGLRDRRGATLPLMPLAWRVASRESYDLVITSTHACARGFRPGRGALHLSYCHTPMRYAWYPELDHRSQGIPGWAFAPLRAWDRRSARWVDHFPCNSTTVQRRLVDLYQREATVIHPPVDTQYFAPDASAARSDFVLAASRFVPYKRIDVAIGAAAIAGTKLVVAGAGPDEARLRSVAERAGAQVEFRIEPSNAELRELLRRARAFIFPAHEDFGILPVEAQACGTPVIALASGGAMDTVNPYTTGILAEDQTAGSFARALREALDRSWDAGEIRAHALRFSHDRFRAEFRSWVEACLR